MKSVKLNGEILFLSNRAELVRAQLNGKQLSLSDAGPLRDSISTDEITPAGAVANFAENPGSHVYTGLEVDGERPVAGDSVKRGSFAVTVAGKRYGKGSSREHSPISELDAGIRLVIAESFERIYRQNADNVGLLTSTDFGLIERIQRGESIDLDEIIGDRDDITRKILKSGGLLQYGASHLQDLRPPVSTDHDRRPMTITEKILRKHVVATRDSDGAIVPGTGVFLRPDWRFIIEVYSPLAMNLIRNNFGEERLLVDPASILGFADHLPQISASPIGRNEATRSGMENIYRQHVAFCEAYGIKSHGRLSDEAGSEGIAHPIMTEHYALPGQVIVGTDSHTPHAGALGCLAFGVGVTDMTSAMLTGAMRVTVPDSLLVRFDGELPAGVTAKDAVLHLLAHPSLKLGGVGRVIEFAGTTIEMMSIDERTTLTNMAAELGGFTGIVAPDEKTLQFLRERRGIEATLDPWMRSDADAEYVEVIEIDTSMLSPYVARPGDPGNGLPISELIDRPRLDIAYGGTCTGGKREDFEAYHEVLSWALEKGLTVAPGVRLYLQFGTLDVRQYCLEHGYIRTFDALGVELLAPGCGACANVGPGSSERAEQVTVSAQNRNFPGRSGPGQVWLASPSTVAASAIAGKLVSFEELQELAGKLRME